MLNVNGAIADFPADKNAWTKLLEQLKPGFQRTINWNKFKPEVKVQQQNWYLDLLISLSLNLWRSK